MGSEMCIRDSPHIHTHAHAHTREIKFTIPYDIIMIDSIYPTDNANLRGVSYEKAKCFES